MKIWDLNWMKRGKQKQAIFQSIRYPMSPSEILKTAKKINPKITFGDVSNIIRQAERKGIIYCLTPIRLTGRIYFLTQEGRKEVNKAYDLKIKKEGTGIDWHRYADIAAGRTRRDILHALYGVRIQNGPSLTLAQIRRKVNKIYPITLNQTLDSMHSLMKNGTARISGYTKKRNSKQYELTDQGMRMAEYLEGFSQ